MIVTDRHPDTSGRQTLTALGTDSDDLRKHPAGG
jgi:hypothetical protein